MLPWEYALPPVVYKYLAPELFFVLSSASVRFSQRSVFPDDHELQPGYAIFGTQDEIWRYAISIGFPLERNGVPAAIIVAGMAESATAQRLGIQSVMQNTRAIDEVGVFCVTEAANCEQMWTEYAKNGTGFAIGFDPALEQQTIIAKQQREATTNAINADISRRANLAGNMAQVNGTLTSSLQNFRMH